LCQLLTEHLHVWRRLYQQLGLERTRAAIVDADDDPMLAGLNDNGFPCPTVQYQHGSLLLRRQVPQQPANPAGETGEQPLIGFQALSAPAFSAAARQAAIPPSWFHGGDHGDPKVSLNAWATIRQL
jgi:hypothetical protein